MKLGLAALGLGLASLASACSAPADPSALRGELLSLDAAFSRASVESGAADAFGAYLADDAVELLAGEPPVRGREAIVAELRDEPGAPRNVLKWAPEDGAATHDLGYTWGHYELSVPAHDGKEGRVLKGKYLTVWRRAPDGKWKVVTDIGSADPVPR